MYILGQRSTHSGRLERWLGPVECERISQSMVQWYGPPIPVARTPGGVYAVGGGDFVGPIDGGFLANLNDFAAQRARRISRNFTRRQANKLNAGFSSLGDLISEATAGGKRRSFQYRKVGTTGVVGLSSSLWTVGNQPAAGAAGGAAPSGTANDDSTTGAFPFANPSGGDTQHLVRADSFSSAATGTLLLYDRIFSVAKTMNSTATEAVTGVPTRYQSTTSGVADSAAGNFLFMECRSALAATAHNWTVCQYTDESGNTGASLPSVTGISACLANNFDMPTASWFAPLATGDTGVQKLTQMQCSALVATGTLDFVMGHALAFMPIPLINMNWIYDGINSAFNLTRIFDDACLALIEVSKPATTATTYAGQFDTVAG